MARLKFKVQEITRHDYNGKEMRSIKLLPVAADSDPESENSRFWEATPTGELRFTTSNMAAADEFVLGEACYIDVTFPGR